ncbi:MAG: molybdopterin oxidoreductase family protein [Pseudomonadota bacterium]|nr:molybdopterin oxidoreductase family protein [Pseudomonadota bacterium]
MSSIHSHLPFNQPELSAEAIGTHTHYRTCTLCEAMCGIVIQTEDQQIVSIRGDQADPFSQGYICPKATALQDLHEDPNRIRHPIKRTAAGWQKISWDEALDTVVTQLKSTQKQYGKDAVAAYLGNPNAHNMGTLLLGQMFLKSLKTKNKFSATSVDQLPHHIVSYQLFGHYLYMPVPDIDHTDFFLIIGGNPLASNGSIMTVPNVKKRLKAIQQRGGKVVVIDPRLTETAEIASQHIFIKPASDALLLLAMLHVLHAERLLKPNRLHAFTPDLDQLGQFVAAYPPERVAEHTGIDATTIRQLTRQFAAAPTAVCYGRMGASVQAFGTLTQYLIMLLNLLTGRLDHRGGLMFASPAADILGQSGRGHIGRYHSRVRGLPEFAGELPVSALAEEILVAGQGQIRALIVAAGNPVLSTPNGTQLDQALGQLDFMVSVDFYINETNRHAHIILPPVGPLERDHYDLVFHLFAVRNSAKWSNALFAPQGDARQDWQIYLDLALRMQDKHRLFQPIVHKVVRELGPATIVDGLLRSGQYGGKLKLHKGLSLAKLKQHPHGIDLGALQPQLPQGLWHKDKTIHLALDYFMPDLNRLERHFFGSAQQPAAHTEYPFQLIGRRHLRSNNSWLHNSHRLVKGKSRCTVMLHPDDAATLGITDQQLVTVRSRVGSIQLPAEITTHLMRGVISIPHGWGHNKIGTQWPVAEQHAGVSINDLTDEQAIDQLSGNAVLNGIPVQLHATPAMTG